jgi:hypothetical protein
MIAACADFAFAACPHDVSAAILIAAEKGSSALHALFLARFCRIE